MALQIEKKFLLPPCKATRYVERLGVQWTKECIEQFRPSQRLCKKGQNYYATVKSGQGVGAYRNKSVISKEQFAAQLCYKEGNFLANYQSRLPCMDCRFWMFVCRMRSNKWIRFLVLRYSFVCVPSPQWLRRSCVVPMPLRIWMWRWSGWRSTKSFYPLRLRAKSAKHCVLCSAYCSKELQDPQALS